MNKLTKLLIVLIAATGSLFAFAPQSHANDAMKEMADRGIINGYADGTYGAGDPVTRQQFAAFISRALDLPEGDFPFTDVSTNSALGEEVGKVYAAGIMQGLSEQRFAPDAQITREQVVMTLEKVVEYSGMEIEAERMEFTDQDQMTSHVLKAIFNIAQYEIVAGFPDGSFQPKLNATRGHAATFIARFLEAKEAADDRYAVASVENDKLTVQRERYETYAAAAAVFESDASAEALVKGGEIFRIKNGIVYGDATHTTVVNGKTVSEVTTVYSGTEFARSQQMTYIEPGREMLYLDATEDYVKVQVGGTIGYVKQNEVELVPESLVTGDDYYVKSVSGELFHRQYNHASNKPETAYPIGPAPADMKTGVKYDSLDGVHFEAQDGSSKITHYPYFQYQSVRTTTNYTGDELDRYIVERLNELNNAEQALAQSKLVGMGEFFIEMQDKHNINALFLLAAAMHESSYGTSSKAQKLNNLYGIEVYDNQTEKGKVYATPQESIEDFADTYMNRSYADTHSIGFYKGAAPGNKTTGINVMYASDPAWGSKVAGHMYRADKALGQKDINEHQLGLSNTPSTNVRAMAGTDQILLYEFGRTEVGIDNAFGYPVVILDEQIGSNGELWYQVISDLKAEDDDYNGIGWIQANLIDKINKIK
ncbi:S-layer homology domain-containing protein [Planococcus salinus]|uniref:SLH domain-containing protein n=1 Tax=Planococcus salinus TaxID=1848460 RepID=A0A3M8P8G2_9BACL|nr:S-layer homology domain-containing protein [Planococcus salinus]RNF39986.1 hypothetical protein EEX84_04920 [Planococcus salinus]